MARVVQFEIAADDPERAARFYEQALGWRIERRDESSPRWLVSTGDDGVPGVDGAIKDRPSVGPQTVNTIPVPSLERAMIAVRDAGGSVQGDVRTIPEVGRFVYATDTEGNTISLVEEEGRRPAVLGPAKRVL